MPVPRVAVVVVAALSFLPTAAQPQQLDLTAADASKIVEGCATHAKAKGQSHAIAVYDSGGNAVATLRMDGNGSGIMAFAMQKAEATARWGFSTANMEAATRETPGFAAAPGVVTVPGGVPVFSADGQRFLGAVGVSGEAPKEDAACAEAGIAAAGLSSSRKARPEAVPPNNR